MPAVVDPRAEFDQLMGTVQNAPVPSPPQVTPGANPQVVPQAAPQVLPSAMAGQNQMQSTDTTSRDQIDRTQIDQKMNGANQMLQAEYDGAAKATQDANTDADAASATARQSAEDLRKATEEHVAPLDAQAVELKKQYDDLGEQRLQHTAKVEAALGQMDDLSKRIAAEQPHDIWAEAGLGTKIAATVLMGLGAAAQSIYKDKTNAVADQIEAYINRDLTMQRMRIEKNKNDYANKGLLLNQLSQHFDHMETAQLAAYTTGMQGVIGRLQVQKELLSGPTLIANADKAMAELKVRQADAAMKLQTMIGGKQASLLQAQAGLETQIGKVNATATTTRQKLALAYRQEGRLDAKEGRLAKAEVRKDAEFEFTGYKPKDEKGFFGSKQDASKFRDADRTAHKVDAALGALGNELDKVKSPLDLLSTSAYRDYAARMAQLMEAGRGPGYGQTGSRFTKDLKELETAAFTPGALGRMTPQQSKIMVNRIRLLVRQGMRQSSDEQNLVPSKHDMLGGE